jgi:quercetin dioxygenase-like cupin family protein
MRKPIRRVVTGHDAAGRSAFVMDGPAPHVYCRSPGSAVVTELWETRATPADNRGNAEVTDHGFRLAPPKNGTVFRIIEYPPDTQRLAALEQQRASADDGSGHGAALESEASGQRGNSIVRAPDTRPEPGSSARAAFDRGSPRHPGFHKTSSVDYAIVLAGEIYALMDEGEVLLKQGDILVQRGTNHAWSNRSDAPAYLAFVLIDAEPL